MCLQDCHWDQDEVDALQMQRIHKMASAIQLRLLKDYDFS